VALLGELVLEQFDGLPDGLIDEPAGAVLVQGDGPEAGAALGRLRPAVQLPWQRAMSWRASRLKLACSRLPLRSARVVRPMLGIRYRSMWSR
jgi:hypothetical protein